MNSKSKLSQSAGTSQNSEISSKEHKEKLKINLVKYVLNKSTSKKPMKRSEMVALILNGDNKMFPQLWPDVENVLNDIYGIGIQKVPAQTKEVSFITFSKMPSLVTKELMPEEYSRKTLLFLILSYLFMKGDKINEKIIFKYLSKLRIDVLEDHAYFGPNLKKLITDTFVKQLYLSREKIEAVGSTENEYSLAWGFRSFTEFSKKKILEEVAQILGKPAICFSRQHTEVNIEN